MRPNHQNSRMSLNEYPPGKIPSSQKDNTLNIKIFLSIFKISIDVIGIITIMYARINKNAFIKKEKAPRKERCLGCSLERP